jgi:hypothetical protein
MKSELWDPRSRPASSSLPDRLRACLADITPSHEGDLTYWPCAARLKDGSVLSCVYMVAEKSYLKRWGVYPEQDRGKGYIYINNIDALADSPNRLPATFANHLDQAGESGMGYTIFTIRFSDGSTQAYVSGNAIDFIRYPEGKGPGDVVGVSPHEGRGNQPVKTPNYYWCLFSG